MGASKSGCVLGSSAKIRAALWEDRALSYYGKLTCPVLLVPAAARPQPGEALPARLENADEFAAAKGLMAATGCSCDSALFRALDA